MFSCLSDDVSLYSCVFLGYQHAQLLAMMRVGILAGGVEMPAEHIVPPSQRLIISASVPKAPDLTVSSPT